MLSVKQIVSTLSARELRMGQSSSHILPGDFVQKFCVSKVQTPERELAGMMKSCAVTDNISPVRSKHLKAKKTASATGGDFLMQPPKKNL